MMSVCMYYNDLGASMPTAPASPATERSCFQICSEERWDSGIVSAGRVSVVSCVRGRCQGCHVEMCRSSCLSAYKDETRSLLVCTHGSQRRHSVRAVPPPIALRLRSVRLDPCSLIVGLLSFRL